MKNTQKGFIIPLIFGIFILVMIGGGAYFYVQNKNLEEKIAQSKIVEANSAVTTTNNTSVASVPATTKDTESVLLNDINQNPISVSSGDFLLSGTVKNFAASTTFGVVVTDTQNKQFFGSGVGVNIDGKWSVKVTNIPNGNYTITLYADSLGPKGQVSEYVAAKSLIEVK